MHGDDGLFIA